MEEETREIKSNNKNNKNNPETTTKRRTRRDKSGGRPCKVRGAGKETRRAESIIISNTQNGGFLEVTPPGLYQLLGPASPRRASPRVV